MLSQQRQQTTNMPSADVNFKGQESILSCQEAAYRSFIW